MSGECIMSDATQALDLGYDLVDRFFGKGVRVFLCSGSVLSGELIEFQGKHIVVKNDRREAVINLDHVASITRL